MLGGGLGSFACEQIERGAKWTQNIGESVTSLSLIISDEEHAFP